MCVIDGCYEEISRMAKSIHRDVAKFLITNMTLVQRHRLSLMLYWAAAIEGLSQSRAGQVSSALESDFDVKDVPAVLPVVPLLSSAIQTAFKNALKKAVDARDDTAFGELYDQLISCSKTCAKEAAERHRLEAENERLRNENATLKEQERRGTERPRDEMEGQQQQQQKGDADRGMKS
ncbi:unnamed protein product [Vitrella brassicaformis CCMP3155]|uniref:Uncharacterized protein n=1 Tax=Vitrella brassicaformis (strain CCMP3155) TaxID=1169540 RepID=A0A0G4EUQ8_VITBC|nr:unnamed protein product [Vitrella brassicaformis CCMP3155]|eukprot:CEM01978.1 unnamed protein product [Vitrella brassicaformis CCMP3155]